MVLKKAGYMLCARENISFHVFVHCQLIFIEYNMCAWNHGILGQQNLPSLEVYLYVYYFELKTIKAQILRKNLDFPPSCLKNVDDGPDPGKDLSPYITKV